MGRNLDFSKKCKKNSEKKGKFVFCPVGPMPAVVKTPLKAKNHWPTLLQVGLNYLYGVFAAETGLVGFRFGLLYQNEEA